MEPTEACPNEEWESSLSGIFSNSEADHFMAHLYGANNEYSDTFRNNGTTSSNFLTIDETIVNINDNIGSVNLYNFADSFPNFQFFSEKNSYSNGIINSTFFPTHGYETNHFFSKTNQMQVSSNNAYELRNISSNGVLVPNFPHHVMEESFITKTELVNHANPQNEVQQESTVANLGEELKLKRKNNVQEHETSGDEKMNELVESPKKNPRVPRDAQEGKRNALSKKNKKNSLDGTDEERSGTKNTQDHPNSCNSEDENSNTASQDFKGKANTALNSSRKTRACRGAATDPQSLYARRRRERINERLRILQNLVPNGTKVDISTMLEEAVQYVKFLQLQIKLLSSDELWMYAPFAYNGMDMGLYEKHSI